MLKSQQISNGAKKWLLVSVGLAIFLTAFSVKAVSLGESAVFNIEASYDLSQRNQTSAILQKITPRAYFYIDNDWWKSSDFGQQSEIAQSLESLSYDFETKIYPVLTQIYGSEWIPGIDNDTRITILIHPMEEEAQGYFNSADEYLKSQTPRSNEREMIYLNSKAINSPNAKIFLAHEFSHLITFNQKEKKYGVSEDIWLNEARAEYTSTLLGYDSDYQNSNIRRRVKNFMDSKFDSLTEWRSQPFDYGVLNLFTQYLVDHYGVNILADSLQSKKAGIESFNEALRKNGFPEDFSQIFTDWTIAIYINNCEIGSKYCYKNENLKNFKLSPITNFLPLVGSSTLSTANRTKDWAGNWFKFTGGRGKLKIEFTKPVGSMFRVPYILEDSSGKLTVNFLQFNEFSKGEIEISNFGLRTVFVTFLPSSQNKATNFTNSEPWQQFSFEVSVTEEIQEAPLPNPSPNQSPSPSPSLSPLPTPNPSLTVEQLLSMIATIQKEIIRLQAQLRALTESQNKISCSRFEKDLYFGQTDSDEVRCLQQFLKNRGEEIYSDGLVTGKFLNLTFEAVKRYQSSKGIIQTGYFGPLTRAAANTDLGLTNDL